MGIAKPEYERRTQTREDELNALGVRADAPCEDCGSSEVFSTLVTRMVVYWQCQRCGEISLTGKRLL
jgi:ribosomal protein L37AE/L43A